MSIVHFCWFSSAAMGLLYIAAAVLGMAGIWSARVTGRTGTAGAAALFWGGAALACAVLALTAAAIPSACAILGLRLCSTLFQPFQLDLQNRQVATEHRATALSVHAMLTDSVGVGTNLAFGALAEAGLSLAFWFGGLLCLAGLLLFFLWYRPRRRG